MKTTVSRQEFMEASDRAIMLIPKKVILPITEMYKLEIGKSSMVISSSNSESVYSTTIECDSEQDEEWSGCVNAKQMHDIIKYSNDTQFKLSTRKRGNNGYVGLVISFGKSRHEIPVTQANDFISLNISEEIVARFNVEAELFKSVTKRITRLIPKEHSNILLTGMCIGNSDIHEGKLMLTGGDGQVLVTSAIKPSHKDISSNIVINRYISNLICHMFSFGGEIECMSDGKLVFISDQGSKIVAVLMDQSERKYPNVENLIIKNITPNAFATITRQEALFAISRLKTHTTDTERTLRFSVSDESIEMSIQNNAYDTEGKESISIFGSPKPHEAGCNVYFLEDAIEAIDDVMIDMSYRAGEKAIPIILSSHNKNEKENTTVLLAPLKV
jgi:DNA polymerase III sliding clamp (beta) subunit (PCNA family)